MRGGAATYWLTIVGLGLIAAPFVLGYRTDPAALWSDVLLGALIATVSSYKAAARDRARWEYWVVGVAGLLAVAAPFVLGFLVKGAAVWAGVAMWTSVILGGVAATIAAYQLAMGQTGAPSGAG